jgi:hypothetical protein
MIINSVAKRVKKFVPLSLFKLLKRAGIAVTFPIVYSYYTGHFKSTVLDKPVDRNGKPVLWHSQSAIDFLSQIDFQGRSVLEFGAGHSTLWWSERAEKVIALEGDKQWYDYLCQKKCSNVELCFTNDDDDVFDKKIRDCRFDVIIVDGLDRIKCAERALALITDDGAIIIDNSEFYRWSAPIMKMFREAGYYRVDFYGYVSCKFLPQCTSLLFKDKCFLLEGKRNPIELVESGYCTLSEA